MKYFVIATCCALVGAGLYLALDSKSHPAKYYAVETEAKARPAYFEDMKYHEVEVRAPASETK